MNNYKKLLSICLTIILVLSVFSVNTTILAQRNTRHKYVVVTRNHNHTKERIGKENIHKEHIYKDTSDVIVADMSEYEAEQLEATDEVVAVVEDISLYAHSEESEETLEEQQELWNVQMINAEELTQNEQTVKVGVMDSGINFGDNISVAGNVDFVEEETPFLFPDYSGHGTAVASVISSKNFGVKPNSSMYSIKVIDSSNEALLSNVLSGIYWAIENDVKILNMSFGTATYSPALEQAINDAYNAGILIIASAGNGTEKMYPAGFENVIAVGSLDHKGEVVSENSQHYTNNLLFAPGERVATEGDFGFVQESSGTSFACPHVTAIAAQILEKDQTKTNDFVKSLLFASANTSSGVKVLDAQYALQNYDEFESTYQPTATTPPTLSNVTDLTTFTDVEFEALWRDGQHFETVTEAAGFQNFTDNQQKMLKVFSAIPDKTNITMVSLESSAGAEVTISGTTYEFENYFDAGTELYYASETETDTYSSAEGNTFRNINLMHKNALHSRYNYVQSLRYLFNVARNLWHNNYYSNENYNSTRRRIIRKAMQDALPSNEVSGASLTFYGDDTVYALPVIHTDNDTNGDYIITDIDNTEIKNPGTADETTTSTRYSSRQLRRALERMMYLAVNCKSDTVYLEYDSTTYTHRNFQKEAAIKILGIAIHLLGDTYAHKTVVYNDINFVEGQQPGYSTTTAGAISNTIYSGSAAEGSTPAKDFNAEGYWSGTYGIKTLIQGGMLMNTHYIKDPWQRRGRSDNYYKQGDYEDNQNFISERYLYSKEAVDTLISWFRSNANFSAEIYKVNYDVVNTDAVKMNHKIRLADLRQYVHNAGLVPIYDNIVYTHVYLRYYDSATSLSNVAMDQNDFDIISEQGVAYYLKAQYKPYYSNTNVRLSCDYTLYYE